MKKSLIKKIAFVVIIISLFIAVRLYLGPVQFFNPAYLRWVMSNEPCTAEYLEGYVLKDPFNSRIIRGLSEDQILERFPMLRDADDYAKDSYRGEVIAYWRNNFFKGKNLKMLWFDDRDGPGWAVVVVDGTGQDIELIKG